MGLLSISPVYVKQFGVSSEIFMYTFHCTAYTGVKHFLVDASINGMYHFVGPKQQNFKSIPDLLSFYR